MATLPAITSYNTWPFRPYYARSLDETEKWWDLCYYEGEVERVLAGHFHWRIIAGAPGSGKGVALEAIKRVEAAVNASLLVAYPPDRWPGSEHAPAPAGNHLAQIMVLAATELGRILSRMSSAADLKLSATQYEFIRWLLEKYTGPRGFVRWLDSLPAEVAAKIQDTPFEDLYPTTTHLLDVQGQIEELVNVARRLGYRRILLTVDLNQYQAKQHLQNLGELFQWLDLMHHRDLGLVAAIPSQAVEDAQLQERARGRFSIVHLNRTAEEVRRMANRHLSAALGSDNVHLSDLLAPELLHYMEDRLISEFGQAVPDAWVALAETTLYYFTQPDQSPTTPIHLKQQQEVERLFYIRHMPLRLDNDHKGIWRGPRLITLSEKLVQFVEAVHRYGHNTDSLHYTLIQIATSKGNIHTLARRLRQEIEPQPKNPIYLVNNRDGYFLEHCLPADSW